MPSLISELSQNDLRIADLELIYQRYATQPGLRRQVLSALEQLDPNLTHRALWIFRRSLKDLSPPSIEELARLIEFPDNFTHWIARLQFCQLMAAIEIPAALHHDAFSLLTKLARDSRPIVRAWAISALYPHRNTQGPFRSAIRTLIADASHETSKAMQARLRRLQSANRKAPPRGNSRSNANR